MMDDPFDEVRRHMHRLLETMTPFGAPPGAATAEWLPAVDVYETADAVIVVVDLAGVAPQDIDLRLEGRRLFASGHREPIMSKGTKRIHHLEIPHGRFRIAVDLPALVDLDRSHAVSHNGLLEIVLPHPRPVRPRVAAQKETPVGGR
jgi:HSP20 family protein